jgi:glycerate-2-kinase
VTLAISDVPGDDPAVIAQVNRAIQDLADARAVAARYRLELPMRSRAARSQQ